METDIWARQVPMGSGVNAKKDSYAYFLVAIVALAGIAFGAGEWIGRTSKVAMECEPGYIKSARYPDGRLDCWYRVTDWRGVIVRRTGRVK